MGKSFFFSSLQSYRDEETTGSPLPAPKTIFCMNRLHTLMLPLPPYNKLLSGSSSSVYFSVDRIAELKMRETAADGLFSSFPRFEVT